MKLEGVGTSLTIFLKSEKAKSFKSGHSLKYCKNTKSILINPRTDITVRGFLFFSHFKGHDLYPRRYWLARQLPPYRDASILRLISYWQCYLQPCPVISGAKGGRQI